MESMVGVHSITSSHKQAKNMWRKNWKCGNMWNKYVTLTGRADSKKVRHITKSSNRLLTYLWQRLRKLAGTDLMAPGPYRWPHAGVGDSC
jgi:hypothetical protein